MKLCQTIYLVGLMGVLLWNGFYAKALSALQAKSIPVPTSQQYYWQEQERLMFVCLDPATWQGREYDNHSTLLSEMKLPKLDTDQWCQAALSWGAQEILFVSKHTGGFCWWQTDTSEYSVKNIPWKDGKGDLLVEVAKSCQKYGLSMGVYVYPGDDTWGAYLGGGGRTKDPSKQEAYKKIYRQQIKEVIQTISKYTRVAEVWFDGSCIIEVSDIIKQYAPDAVVMQSPVASIRWVGNERGYAPYPTWNTVKMEDAVSGVSTAAHGDPDGDVWMPLEVNTTLRDHHWFWSPENHKRLKTLDYLIECYYKSVGRGGVFLLNSAPDTTGLIPESDMKLYKAFGEELCHRFGKSIAETGGRGDIVELDLGKPTEIDHVITMEDFSFGERVREYVIVGYSGDQWFEIVNGISIGRKRIDRFKSVRVSKIRFRCVNSVAQPIIRKLAVYMVGDEKTYNRLKSTKDDYGNPWTTGTAKKAKVKLLIGDINNFYDKQAKHYTIDLSKHIDEPGQYELFVSKSKSRPSLRPKWADLWLEGVKTPGFCKANKVFAKIEINITAMPTMKEGAIVIKFALEDQVGTEKVYLRKIIFE